MQHTMSHTQYTGEEFGFEVDVHAETSLDQMLNLSYGMF